MNGPTPRRTEKQGSGRAWVLWRGLLGRPTQVALEAENIESQPLWKPMHMQPVFEGCAIYGGAVSERLFERGLCVPSGSALARDQVERVAEIIRRQCRAAV